MWNVIAQGCAILGSILMVYAMGGTITMMVISYVSIVILWVGIWHIFLYQEIRYPLLSALKDILPFLLVAAVTMVITYFATLQLSTLNSQLPTSNRLLILLITRILLATIIYIGLLWLFGAKILKECIGYLLKKK